MVITSAVVLSCLLVLLLDWAFSQLYVRIDDLPLEIQIPGGHPGQMPGGGLSGGQIPGGGQGLDELFLGGGVSTGEMPEGGFGAGGGGGGIGGEGGGGGERWEGGGGDHLGTEEEAYFDEFADEL